LKRPFSGNSQIFQKSCKNIYNFSYHFQCDNRPSISFRIFQCAQKRYFSEIQKWTFLKCPKMSKIEKSRGL